MYLLDTNVVSELRKLKPHGQVVEWLAGTPNASLNLSAVTLGEIQSGIELTRVQNVEKAREIEAWANQVEETWSILPVDSAIFRLAARMMHAKSPDLLADALIAATATRHGLVVVTRNKRDFIPFGVEVFDPFLPI